MSDAICEVCGEPMPDGEEMFKFHGYSGKCPKPPLLTVYQRRVIGEKEELDRKIQSLRKFMVGEEYSKLNEAEAHRLAKQSIHMIAYSDVLAERISAFSAA
jgi:hypothetical protein